MSRTMLDLLSPSAEKGVHGRLNSMIVVFQLAHRESAQDRQRGRERESAREIDREQLQHEYMKGSIRDRVNTRSPVY